MKTKHTKGEWKVETQPLLRPKGCTKYYITSNNGELLITEFTRVDYLKDEAEANAKLIASAPDLLEALIKLYGAIDSCIDLTPELIKDCKNAIKKATT